MGKQPAITILDLLKMMMTGNSSSATLRTASSRRSQYQPNHKNQALHLACQSIQQSTSGIHLSQLSESV